MKKSLPFKFVLVLALTALISTACGQSPFAFQADLGKVQQAGFYRIDLDPEIVARSKADLSDIRIMDNNGRQVPYILKAGLPVFRENHFTEFPIVSLKKEKDKQTHLVIRNKTRRPVSELLLVIRNTAANRTVTVSGSDDRVQWFVIRENIPLDHFFNPDKDSYVQSLGFPTSSYNYLKIIIEGEDLLPVNIVRAGIYEELVYNGTFSPLPAPSVMQKDSTDKSSYVTLSFSENYQVDKLGLELTGPRFYKRHLSVQQGNNRPVELSTHTIRSDVRAEFPVGAKTNRIILRIVNEDNVPLRVTAVRAWQLNNYLLTYLEPANDYHLVFGDANARAPSYDLDFFKNSIGNAAKLQAGPVRKLNAATAGNTGATPGRNTVVLWVVIAAVLGLLLLLTYRMTRQVDGKENT